MDLTKTIAKAGSVHEAAGFHVVGETENEWILEADLSAIN